MIKGLLALLLLLGTASAVAAKPKALTDAELAAMTAGFEARPVGPTRAPPPVWTPVPPGGPILISCIVGVGCITRSYH